MVKATSEDETARAAETAAAREAALAGLAATAQYEFESGHYAQAEQCWQRIRTEYRDLLPKQHKCRRLPQFAASPPPLDRPTPSATGNGGV